MRHRAHLVSEDELPSWLLKDVAELEQEEFEENEGRLFGLGEEWREREGGRRERGREREGGGGGERGRERLMLFYCDCMFDIR